LALARYDAIDLGYQYLSEPGPAARQALRPDVPAMPEALDAFDALARLMPGEVGP
jgi:hypothetical protein